ncbi:MAG: uroporphyrinogen decarboxylase family protein [Verrucomicrobia bacterium]|nr:uroporphyrinogen decarboxylase family protein [Verrucomicrobiota bacterium]
MDLKKWDIFKRCGQRRGVGHTPVALIVDSPWIPGHLGISTLDYLSVPEVWLEANLRVEQELAEAILLPGFWVEMGMTAEPSAFGCKVSLFPDRTPIAHPLTEKIEALEGLTVPDPLTDGLLPLILNYYRRAEPRINDAGHVIKMVAARGPLTVASHLLGVTEFLLALKLKPAATQALLRVTATLVRTWLQAQADALEEVEAVMVLDDIAGFLSPTDYLEFAHPHLKTVFDAFPGALKVFHNDTNNAVSYRHMADLGIHIFNFTHLQPLDQVRRLVGPDLCLMGNVPPLEVLAEGTPDQVRTAARHCLEIHGRRPGLLLSAGGGVSPGTPGANLAALIEAARDGDPEPREHRL